MTLVEQPVMQVSAYFRGLYVSRCLSQAVTAGYAAVCLQDSHVMISCPGSAVQEHGCRLQDREAAHNPAEHTPGHLQRGHSPEPEELPQCHEPAGWSCPQGNLFLAFKPLRYSLAMRNSPESMVICRFLYSRAYFEKLVFQ